MLKESVVRKRKSFFSHVGKFTLASILAVNLMIGSGVSRTGLLYADEGSAAPKGTVEIADGMTVVRYEYEKAGKVTAKYVDDSGTEIKTPDVFYLKQGDRYDTEEKRPASIRTENDKLYALAPQGNYPVGAVSDNGNLTRSDIDTVRGTDDVSGEADVNKDKEVTYVYTEVRSGVVVEYYNTKGEKIDEDNVVAENGNAGDPYTTANVEHDEIQKGEKLYYFKKWDDTSAPKEGQLTDGIQTVRFIYEEAGKVKLNYVDTEGNPIKETEYLMDEVEAGKSALKPGKPYNKSVEKKKLPVIELDDGRTYQLAPQSDAYPVGKVSENGNLIESKLPNVTGTDAVTGEIESGKTKEITFVYKLVKGKVIVKYVDEKGNPLSGTTEDGKRVENTVEAVAETGTGTPYDVRPIHQLDKIIAEDGTVYYRMPNETVGVEHGNVTVGENEVIYKYQKAGSVVINYVDKDGNPIKDKVELAKNANPETAYNTKTAEHRPEKFVTADGKTYKLAQQGTYKAGEVADDGHLTQAGADVKAGVADPEGTVEAGVVKEVTYVYEEVKGKVTVKYVDENGDPLFGTTEDGKAIAESVEDTAETSTGVAYDTTDHKPNVIIKDGVVYRLKGTKAGSDPENGKVKDGETTITYEYEKVAAPVKVKYEDENGKEIKDPTVLVGKISPTDPTKVEPYNTAVPEVKPNIIEKEGKIYRLEKVKDKSAAEQGAYTTEEQTVTYVYKEVAGSLVVAYVDEAGTKIAPDALLLEEVDEPTDYDVEKSGKKLKLVEYRGEVYEFKEHETQSDDELGTLLPNETKVVTYVYKKMVGAVVVKYVDEDGNPLKENVIIRPEGVGEYDVSTMEFKPSTLEKDGVKYTFLKTDASSASIKGNVGLNEQKVVVYVYSKKRPSVPGKERGFDRVYPHYGEQATNPTTGTETKKDLNIPKTGEVPSTALYSWLSLLLAGVLAAVVLRKRTNEIQN